MPLVLRQSSIMQARIIDLEKCLSGFSDSNHKFKVQRKSNKVSKKVLEYLAVSDMNMVYKRPCAKQGLVMSGLSLRLHRCTSGTLNLYRLEDLQDKTFVFRDQKIAAKVTRKQHMYVLLDDLYDYFNIDRMYGTVPSSLHSFFCCDANAIVNAKEIGYFQPSLSNRINYATRNGIKLKTIRRIKNELG